MWHGTDWDTVLAEDEILTRFRVSINVTERHVKEMSNKTLEKCIALDNAKENQKLLEENLHLLSH